MSRFAIAVFLVACGDKSDDTSSSTVLPAVTWSEAFDTTATGSLSGVWGTGPDDVFIVGGTEEKGEIYHYDGSDWGAMTVPDGLGLLVWCYGFASDDVYVVGVSGAMAHYDGSSWSAIETGTEKELWGVWGTSGSDLWIVGGDPDTDTCGDPEVEGEQACLWYYDGSTLSPYALAESENDRGVTSIFKVWGVDGLLLAVGQKGLLLEHNGSDWIRVSGGAEANDDFVSLWGTSSADIVSVGGRSNARLATRKDGEWSTTSPSGIGGLNAVFMPQPDEAIVGGIYGWVGRYVPSTDTLEEEGFLGSTDIHAIWGDGAGRVYAVGGNFTAPHVGVAYVRVEE